MFVSSSVSWLETPDILYFKFYLTLRLFCFGYFCFTRNFSLPFIHCSFVDIHQMWFFFKNWFRLIFSILRNVLSATCLLKVREWPQCSVKLFISYLLINEVLCYLRKRWWILHGNNVEEIKGKTSGKWDHLLSYNTNVEESISCSGEFVVCKHYPKIVLHLHFTFSHLADAFIQSDLQFGNT